MHPERPLTAPTRTVTRTQTNLRVVQAVSSSPSVLVAEALAGPKRLTRTVTLLLYLTDDFGRLAGLLALL